MRLKTEAEERGEDLERKKNWEYTIEENDEWEKKKRRKERNADFEFHGGLNDVCDMRVLSNPLRRDVKMRNSKHANATRRILFISSLTWLRITNRRHSQRELHPVLRAQVR